MKKFIWLYGENLGKTFDNNSYYFWEQVCELKDEIEKYLILEKNKKTVEFYNSLSKTKKNLIIWRNSFKHFKLFKQADMYFVSLSYRDILPEKIFNKSIKLIIKKPVIYLQHGTTAIKKLGYKGDTYYNNLFRFFYYNPEMKEKFMNQNKFNEYQLYNAEFHPRYKKMVEYYLNKQKTSTKKILFFITWREYFGDNFNTKKFIKNLNKVFENEKLQDFIQNGNCEIQLCMHQFYDENKIAIIKNTIKDINVKLIYPSEVNLMKELATCDLLITDYSSVGFDCTFLNIPVILYQPDYDTYFNYRESYYSVEELNNYNVKTPEELVDAIISGQYRVNEYFKTKSPKRANYKAILNGEHITRMYNELKNKQLNKITIIGYNFTGKGGTVSSTKALAEALMEKGYLVDLLSLKATEKKYSLPYGLGINSLYNKRQNKWLNRIKRNLFKNKKNYYYLSYDINKKLLLPYTGWALKKYLEKTNSKTIISTRESVHLFVKNFANENVVNKIYFFHTDSTVLNNYYPNLIEEIKKYTLENCVFVTEASKNAYKKDLGYENYHNSHVIGNTLESNSMIQRKYIRINKKRKNVFAVSLMRLSQDRKNDIDNILSFGKYLVKNNVNNILIKVYGQGEMVSYFEEELLKNDLENVIEYKGATNSPKNVILANDCVIDFCNNQSFGMTYIESILNGKPVFAKENIGSLEVLKDIPYSYYHSEEELLTKLLSVKKMKVNDCKKNYDLISKRYSREKIADEIIKILE